MKQVFVFGSNEAGIHGSGAAEYAFQNYGAVMGEGVGLFGDSYAIPTKDHNIETLLLPVISKYVRDFVNFAWKNNDIEFFVTTIGCGLAGYNKEDMAPMFSRCPGNCILPYEWSDICGSGIYHKWPEHGTTQVIV